MSDNVTGSIQVEIPVLKLIKDAAREHLPELIPEIKQNLTEQIKNAAKVLQPNLIVLPNKKEIELVGKQHKEFKKVLSLLSIHKQLFLCGPTGSGKTHLSEQCAKAFGLSFSHLSCTAGMSESHLNGRMLADGSYVSTNFVNAYENGGVFLLDEIDAADSNVLLLINSAIANGVLSIPNRKENPVAIRNEDFYLIVSSNTWGHGSFEYSGREVLDKAFLDRFCVSKIYVDYDKELENHITNNSKFTRALQAVRGSSNIERSISTRMIIDCHKMSNAFTFDEICDFLLLGWTIEEKSKFEESFSAFLDKLKEVENSLETLNAEGACNYADEFGDRLPEVEDIIKTDPNCAYHYAENVIKGRWPEAENIIKTNPESAFNYVREVIKGRWIEAEEVIKTDPEYACYYAQYVIKGRFPEAEEYIKTNPEYAYYYARDVIEGRWIEAEDVIKTDPCWAMYYAEHVIKGRWIEAEGIIKDSDYAEHYAQHVIGDEFFWENL